MDRRETRFRSMGTDAHVVLLDAPPELLGLARERLADLERRWSRFLPGSEISQLNRADGRPLIVSAETLGLISDAIDAWRWSDGRFDPTVGTTMEQAGYDRPFPRRGWPDGRDARHQPCPTPAGIVIDPYPSSVTVPAGIHLDLGGIGKGAAADLVAAEMLANGAAGCCINLGGDLRVAGEPPRPEGWRIEVEVEGDRGLSAVAASDTEGGQEDDQRVPARIGVIDGAVCTSTRLRRAWMSPLGPQHHLRHPATGAPLRTGLATVTVVAARATQAEVLTKAAFGAGPIEGGRLIGRAGATGLLVTDDGTTIELDGFRPFAMAGATWTADD